MIYDFFSVLTKTKSQRSINPKSRKAALGADIENQNIYSLEIKTYVTVL